MKTGKTMWCFGIVNKKLAEIYFDKKNGKVDIWGHCYVKKEDYKTKEERKWIEEDTENIRVVYRNKKYKLKRNQHRVLVR